MKELNRVSSVYIWEIIFQTERLISSEALNARANSMLDTYCAKADEIFTVVKAGFGQ